MQSQSEPVSPSPQYDFILKDNQRPKRSLGISRRLPKPVLIILAAVVGVFIVILIFSILTGGRGADTQKLVNVVGRAAELSRVSGLVITQTKEPDTQNLAATAQAALASQQAELTKYLTDRNVKVAPAALLIFQDKKTDTSLQAAAAENKLEQTYNDYLKKALADYETELRAASVGISQTGQALLKSYLDSTQIILSAPQLANAGG